MLSRNRDDALRNPSRRAQHAAALAGVGFHFRELFVRQAAGFVEDAVGYREFPNIVEHAPDAELMEVIAPHAESTPEAD
jgi:hypothetical protein